MPVDVVRWTLEDPSTGESYTFSINPNEAENYRFGKRLEFGRAIGDRIATKMGALEPVDWSFGGVIRSQEQHDALEYWSKKPGKVRVTDHLGRTFEIMISKFEPTDRTPTETVPWRFNYTMSALILRRLA